MLDARCWNRGKKMLTYKYIARDKNGKPKQGFLDVGNKDELVRVLQSQGLLLLSFDEVEKVDKTAIKPEKKHRMHSGVKLDDLIALAKQLQVLLTSGITLLRSLEIISLQVQSSKLFHSLTQMKKDISAGSSFKAAIAKYPSIFSNLWVNIINTGETTGQLPFALEQLVTYLESTSSLQRKIKNALVYPSIVICVAVAAVIIFIVKIIPMFADIYSGFDAALPPFSQLVFSVCLSIKQYLLLFVAIAVAAVLGIRHCRKTYEGRKRIDAMLLNLTLIGDVMRNVAAVRFASGLHMLITSGTPILHALEIVSETSSNVIIKEMLQKVKESVREGKSMSIPLLEANIFPSMLAQMVAVGEESGALADMLDNAAKFYEERVDATIGRLAAMFEPMLIVVIGIVVGTLVIAMFLPIFGFSEAIK